MQYSQICESSLTHPLQPYWLNSSESFGLHPEKKETSSNTRVQRLQWILEHSMGAPMAFSSRSAELKELKTFYDDEHVVESFLFSLAPNGFHSKYMMMADIALMIGDTLFVHGSIDTLNIGYVPPYNGEQTKLCTSLEEWIKEINNFAKFEVNEYITKSTDYIASNPTDFWCKLGGYMHAQPGSRLLNYGMGHDIDGHAAPTVIYSDFYSNGKPEPMDGVVSTWLKNAGVRRVIVGHKPHGDAPLIIKCSNDVDVICADLSYAKEAIFIKNPRTEVALPHDDKKHAPAPDYSSRGITTCEILITISGSQSLSDVSEIRLHGNLSNGISYDFTIPKEPATEQVFGKQTIDGWWVKSLIHDKEQKYYLLSRNEGYSVSNTLFAADQIFDILQNGTKIVTIEDQKPSAMLAIDNATGGGHNDDDGGDSDVVGGGATTVEAPPYVIPSAPPPKEGNDGNKANAAPKRGWFSFGSKK